MRIVPVALYFFSLIFKILGLLLVISCGCYFIRLLYRKTALWAEFIAGSSEYHWKRKWLAAHRNGQEIEYKNIDTYNSSRGWALIPSLKDKIFKGSVVNSNSRGARGREEYSGDKECVLFFGDSFCFGEDVNDDQTIPVFFQKKYASFQSVNLGVHGYGIDQQYLYFKEAGPEYRPKITCFIVSFDDFSRNFLKFRDYAKPMFILKKEKVSLTNHPVPEPSHYLSPYRNVPLAAVCFDFLRQVLIYYGLVRKKQRIELCSYLLEQIKLLATGLGSKLIFLYVPNIQGGFYKNYVNDAFIGLFKKSNIEFMNLCDYFSPEQLKGMMSLSSGHFTARSNGEIADKLIEKIKSIV